ncbi:MAG: hypothetical protein Q4G10_01310 [Bacteroidia bacterium]|nr:hypothetical protein [Bacteroidia bacterium]
MTAFCGCNEKEDVFEVGYFTVSGCIYDDSPETSPVEGVTVTITGYSVDDPGRTSPLYSNECVSGSDGSYQFSIISSENLGGLFFMFTVFDEAGWRTVHYEQAERQLYLSPTSSFYNSFMKIYEVKDNDFYLSLGQQ